MTIIYKNVVVEKQEIDKHLCNTCGNEILRYDTKCQALIEHTYGSPRDGDIDEFHLCLGCYDDLRKTFKIKPTTIRSMFADEFTDDVITSS